MCRYIAVQRLSRKLVPKMSSLYCVHCAVCRCRLSAHKTPVVLVPRPSHSPVLIAYCKRSKSGRWESRSRPVLSVHLSLLDTPCKLFIDSCVLTGHPCARLSTTPRYTWHVLFNVRRRPVSFFLGFTISVHYFVRR